MGRKGGAWVCLGGSEPPAGHIWGASEREARLPSGRCGRLTSSLPSRLWKNVWVQVPSPEPFFQPLYMGHSGDFKVSVPNT